MVAYGDTEAINLSTGKQFQRATGNGESFLKMLGIPGLRRVNHVDLVDYECAMNEAIPEIAQAIRVREILAHKSRQMFLVGAAGLCGAQYHDSGPSCVYQLGHRQRHSWADTEPSDSFGG